MQDVTPPIDEHRIAVQRHARQLHALRAEPAFQRLAATFGATGMLGRSWQIGTTALWVALLLVTYVGMFAF